MFKDAIIRNGKLYGVKFSEYFSVQLAAGTTPSVCPTVDFDGMPLTTLIKLAFNDMKVKARPAMKQLDAETLKKVYKGTVSWRVMITKEGATNQATIVDMSDEELASEIARLQARMNKPDAFDIAKAEAIVSANAEADHARKAALEEDEEDKDDDGEYTDENDDGK